VVKTLIILASLPALAVTFRYDVANNQETLVVSLILSIFANEIIKTNKMPFTKKINNFSRALSGIMYPDDYLAYITNGDLQSNINEEYLTVADSKKNLKRDFSFISSDLKKAIKEAKEK
jgi:hypothetical protein